MVAWTPYFAAALGFGPALVLMWYALRRYDYPLAPRALFEFRRAMLLFAVGMVFGMVSASFFNTFAGSQFLGLLTVLVLLALMEEGFKMVLLNLKRFQGRFETTFYGLSMGAGIAAMWVFPQVYLTLQTPGAEASVPVVTGLVLLSVGVAALHCATGAVIGHGAAHGGGMPRLFEAVLMRAVYVSLFLLFIIFTENQPLALAFLAAGLVMAAIFYRYAYLTVLPSTLPEEIRRELRRAARRRTRHQTQE